MEKTMVRQAVPLQPVEDDGGADIHLQPMVDPVLEQVDAPKEVCDPVGNPRRSRLLARPVKRGAHTGAGLLAGLMTLWQTHSGAVCS
ncbi:hypothetical protein GRJ2_000940700 [Grus japonensis]|uniref:Uncharacterized protein n=1 Tax=Grus japonensis TaxID=30415 RepID=A0ABC9WGZ1_GRUJA